MAWATVDQVLALTGKTVTPEALVEASGIITAYSGGATEDLPADAISTRDRATLARATGWQAVWAKPGLTTERESHAQSTADGNSVTRNAPADAILAPLAARELKNLSWVATRTEFVPRGQVRKELPDYLDFTNERSDEYGTWRPLDIA